MITTDEVLIRSILEDPTVIDGFSDGEVIKDLTGGIYFYIPDVGLFPSVLRGNVLSCHAAIPKKNRGIKAVKAVKILIKELVDLGYELETRARHENKAAHRFNVMVGFVCYDTDSKHRLYRHKLNG